MTTSPILQDPVLALPGSHGWTVDDLPGQVDFRYELVDGVLLVSPPADLHHDDFAAQLLHVVIPLLPAGYRAALVPGLYFDRRNYRQSDLMVYRREAVDRGRAGPADTLLAVEVMSPSSVQTDRVTKPAQFAAAGIPHYWRVELDPLLLLAYRLDGESYREVGRFRGEVDLAEPVALRVDLRSLLP